jgi:choice-of-anchor B domain-containing protein
MINLIRIIIIFLLAHCISIGQTSYNIDVIGQRNDHRNTGMGPDTSFHYSSVWGYTAPNGREYAFIGYSDGSAIYDITDAPNVVECDTVPGPESYYNYRNFAVSGNYLYIVSEGTNSFKGLQVVNLSYLPDSVHHVMDWTFPGFNRAHTLESLGSYLYINGADYNSGGVFVVDVTNPENPFKKGNGPPLYVHDCFIKNDTIYAANITANPSRMSVIDATNKDSLRLITEFIYPGAICHLVWTTDDRHYLVTSDEGGSNHARIWDCSDLFNITFVYEYIPYQFAMVHNSYFKGNLLFMAHYRAGVVVLDCSNLPSAPTVAGYYDTFNGQGLDAQGAWNVYPYYPSGKFVVSDMMTGLWVFKFTSSIGIEPAGNENPRDFKLYQNYPNPFNPNTVINYELPIANYVSLIIYNALGKEINSLVNEKQSAGSYEVKWDGSNYPSGVYFYKLSNGDYSETRKMVLLR